MTKFIIGPLKSGHIQRWFKNYQPVASEKLYVFTVHNRPWNVFGSQLKVVDCGLTNTRFDFIFLYVAVFFYSLLLRPKVTSVHFISSYGLSVLGLCSKKILLSGWGSDVNKLKLNKISHKIYSRVLKRVDWINVPSNSLALKLQSISKESLNGKLHIFQYGVDYRTLDKKNIVFKPKTVKFLSNRNWQGLYNIDLILLAFNKFLNDNDISAELHLYGSGTKDEQHKINEIISDFSESVKKCVVVHGFINHGEMLLDMKEYDVFISIPQMDGLPLSLLEAMYIGLLPVVNNLPVYQDLLNSKNAIFIVANEVDPLARAFYQAIKFISDFDPVVNRNKVISEADFDKNTSIFLKEFL